MSTARQDREIRSLGFSGAVGGAPDAAQVRRFTDRWALSPDVVLGLEVLGLVSREQCTANRV